jgi:stearoyl-CoA desaturase (delta-9 desaturase)
MATSVADRSTTSQLPVAEPLTQEKSPEFNWVFFVAIAAFHLGALASLFFFSWSAVVVFLVTWFVGQNVGIAMSYHRQLTHRGFVTPRWLEYAMAISGTMALQGGPMYWVAVHRMHHQYTDKPGDPHSPRDGAWWSHMGWILYGSLHNETKLLTRYVPDLQRSRFYQWLSKYHWLPVTLLGVGLLAGGTALGGWKLGVSCSLWGIFLRFTIGLHVTCLVNSSTHMWGSRRFDVRDDSTNNWWVALLTGGEGWHNNHHAHPVSASHGMAWYELDINYWGIKLLGILGLAKNIKVMRPEASKRSIEA